MTLNPPIDDDPPLQQLAHALLAVFPLLAIAVMIGLAGKATGYNEALYQLLLPNILILIVFLALIQRYPSVLSIRQTLLLYLISSVAPYLAITPLFRLLSDTGIAIVDVCCRGTIMGCFAVYLGRRDRLSAPARPELPHWGALTLKVFFVAFIPFALFNLSATELFKVLEIEARSNVDQMARLMDGDPLGRVAIPILVAVVAPIYEELFFRFLLFGILRRQMGFPLAAGISAIVFALAHGNPLVVAGTGVLGLLFAWVYERSGSIAAPILYHMLWNGTSLAIYLIADGSSHAEGAKTLGTLLNALAGL